MKQSQYKLETIQDLARSVVEMTRTKWWVLLACSGWQGVGKSHFIIQLGREIAKLQNTPFNFEDNITYLREELVTWVDGDEDGKNQKPKFSVIIADELISMFFNRNWNESGQKETIELFNKCRDRRLVVLGAIPSFHQLDKGLRTVALFWVHVHRRGIARVYQQYDNEAAKDPWEMDKLYKIINKNGVPYKSNTFVSVIKFNKLSEADEQEYERVRNVKRVGTEGQEVAPKEKYGRIKMQRDNMIKGCGLSIKEIQRMTGLNDSFIRRVMIGEK